jgi:hypothetical protein
LLSQDGDYNHFLIYKKNWGSADSSLCNHYIQSLNGLYVIFTYSGPEQVNCQHSSQSFIVLMAAKIGGTACLSVSQALRLFIRGKVCISLIAYTCYEPAL